MSIQKFRDISELPPPERVVDPEPRVLRINAAWQRAQLRDREHIPRGITRFRSIADADKARDTQLNERLRKLRDD